MSSPLPPLPEPSSPSAASLPRKQTAPLSATPPTAPFTVPLSRALQRFFGEEERVIVLTLNEAGQIAQYEVKPLAEVVIMLDLHGFGQPLPQALPTQP